jgi:phosphoribosylglycinamide formyltransferase-1
MKKIAVLFSGKGTNFAYIVKHLHNKNLKIAVALTNNPNADGIAIAKENNIPLEIVDSKAYSNREDFDTIVVDRLNPYSVNLTVLAGFMRILTPIFTDSIKSINLHPSLLPRHKGLHAIERSYEDEFLKGGVTVHFVTSKLDDGEIIEQESIKKDNLSFEEYSQKIITLEKEVLAKAILKVLK